MGDSDVYTVHHMVAVSSTSHPTFTTTPAERGYTSQPVFLGPFQMNTEQIALLRQLKGGLTVVQCK